MARDDELSALVRELVGRIGVREAELVVRRTMVSEALDRCSGNRRAAARLLGVSRQHLQHMLRAMTIERAPRLTGTEQALLERWRLLMAQMVDERAQFERTLEHFDTAMLITQSQDGSLRSRPMAVADRDENGDLWFATSLDSPKVDELRADDHAAVAMQSSNRYLSVSGRASIVRDREKIRQLWRPAWKAWFPNGVDDPNIALVCLRTEEGEYWDNHGAKGIKYMLKAAKSVVKGERAPERAGPEQHGKVRL